MSTGNLKNFGLAGAVSVSVTATSSSARVALPNAEVDDLMIVNDSAKIVYVRTGDSSVVADVNAMPIMPREKGVYSRGIANPPITHIAAFVVTGTQAVTIVQGSGS